MSRAVYALEMNTEYDDKTVDIAKRGTAQHARTTTPG